MRKRPREGEPAAEPMDLEEYAKEHDESRTEKIPPPLYMELAAQVERDKKDMLKYCRKAAERRAFPPWRAP
eukprot:5300263-Pyramimonas_sp.AAC.1